MRKENETSEERRERLRQEDWKDNQAGNLHDSLNRGRNGSLVDLVGGLGWKGTGMILLILLLGFIIYALFFR